MKREMREKEKKKGDEGKEVDEHGQGIEYRVQNEREKWND